MKLHLSLAALLLLMLATLSAACSKGAEADARLAALEKLSCSCPDMAEEADVEACQKRAHDGLKAWHDEFGERWMDHPEQSRDHFVAITTCDPEAAGLIEEMILSEAR